MREELLARVREAHTLPSMPAVAIEVLRLMRSDDVGIEDLAAVVEKDPALTAKMLKAVNSSLYARKREITSLKQSMVTLGLRSVKVMVLSFSLVEALSNKEESAFDFNVFWRRSVSTAAAARLIAQRVAPRRADDAFSAGLLSDIGIVITWQFVPKEYGDVLKECQEGSEQLEAIEQRRLGVTHAELAAELLTSWNLPEALAKAVLGHHGLGRESNDGSDRELADVVYAGALTSALFTGDVPASNMHDIKSRIKESTSVNDDDIEAIFESLAGCIAEAADVLSLDMKGGLDYQQIQTEATMQLAQLSVQAEFERAESVEREQDALATADRLHTEKRAILEYASTDSLTRMGNRAAFDQRIAQEFKRAGAAGKPLGMLMIDLDHFKKLNDNYGHQAGDEALRVASAAIQSAVEAHGWVARYGGEEFAVLVPDGDEADIATLAGSICRAVACRPVHFGQQVLPVTCSIGGSVARPAESNVTPDELIADADGRMYEAKRDGRNRSCCPVAGEACSITS